MPERSRTWWRSAFTSVPDGVPAPGWTTRPAGLFTTRRWASSCTTARAMSSALGDRRLQLRDRDRDPLPRAHPRRRAGGGAVHGDRALRDQGLDARAAQVGQRARQPRVEPLPGAGRLDVDGADRRP